MESVGVARSERRRGLWSLGRGLRALGLGALLCAASSAWALQAAQAPMKAAAPAVLTADRFGPQDAAAMGWEAGEATPLDEEARAWAKRLERRRGLPAASLAAARVEQGASSKAISLPDGSCRVLLIREPDAQRSGLDFSRLGLSADAIALESAQEQELLHELGHCQKMATGAGFDHPGLSVDENQALSSSLFAADAGRFEGAGQASALYSEAFADAFMSVKWLEARGFSEPAKTALRAAALFRKAQREDAQAEAGAGERHVEAHMTEEAIELALEGADEIARMSEAQRERAVSRIASQTALRALARSGVAREWMSSLQKDVSRGLALRAFSSMLHAQPARYEAEAGSTAMGAGLERLSAAACQAAKSAARAAGVEWGRGAAGLTEAMARTVWERVESDADLARAAGKELGFLSPNGGLMERALAALSKAESYERAKKPLRLSSLRGALAAAEWPGYSGIKVKSAAGPRR